MKQIRIIMIVTLFTSISVATYAQRVYKEGNYFIINNTAMPAGAVKTTDEVVNGTIDPITGIAFRHQEGSGNGSNPNVNAKVSPKFAVSPQDINLTGTHQTGVAINWMQASGWRNDVSTVTSDGVYGNQNASGAFTSTGCKAYGGPSGTEQGQWRLPTQRELMLLWVLKEKLNQLSAQGYVSFSLTRYWSATEGSATGSWVIDFKIGNTFGLGKQDGITSVRCVKDM